MQAFNGQKLDKIPAHVPPELVYEYDIATDPRVLEDPHARMRSLILEAPPIFFSPYNGGHWFVTRKKAIVDITMNPEVYSSKSPGEHSKEATGGCRCCPSRWTRRSTRCTGPRSTSRCRPNPWPDWRRRSGP
ncbi:hypothetical protein ACN28S_03445 [Cystobacter fuscus]